jgi:hypothetical protein
MKNIDEEIWTNELPVENSFSSSIRIDDRWDLDTTRREN